MRIANFLYSEILAYGFCILGRIQIQFPFNYPKRASCNKSVDIRFVINKPNSGCVHITCNILFDDNSTDLLQVINRLVASYQQTCCKLSTDLSQVINRLVASYQQTCCKLSTDLLQVINRLVAGYQQTCRKLIVKLLIHRLVTSCNKSRNEKLQQALF